jgi:hypothetical protein
MDHLSFHLPKKIWVINPEEIREGTILINRLQHTYLVGS